MTNYRVIVSTRTETFEDLSINTLFEPVEFENPWLWIKISEIEAGCISTGTVCQMEKNLKVKAAVVSRGDHHV